jgi:hypothetical protein
MQGRARSPGCRSRPTCAGSWSWTPGLAVGIAMTWAPASQGPALRAIAQRVRALFGIPEQAAA